MKKIVHLVILAFLVFSCETDDIKEQVETVNQEQFTLNLLPPLNRFGIQEHQEILAWNSFILGELMRISPSDKSFILSAIDPASKTVAMSTLLDQSTNSLFYDHYVFIASNAWMNAVFCMKPGNQDPWPPLDPEDPFGNSRTLIPIEVTSLINSLLINNTELYVQNSTASGNIYTVGHPLVNQLNHIGSMIYEVPMVNYPCTTYSAPTNVGASNQINNDLILLSRPNLSNGNPYSYINFDINRYLQDLGDPDTDDPYISGSQF